MLRQHPRASTRGARKSRLIDGRSRLVRHLESKDHVLLLTTSNRYLAVLAQATFSLSSPTSRLRLKSTDPAVHLCDSLPAGRQARFQPSQVVQDPEAALARLAGRLPHSWCVRAQDGQEPGRPVRLQPHCRTEDAAVAHRCRARGPRASQGRDPLIEQGRHAAGPVRSDS